MTTGLYLIDGKIYLSIPCLQAMGVKKDVPKSWRRPQRLIGEWKVFDGIWAVELDSIPAPTLKLLPNKTTLISRYNREQSIKRLVNKLTTAKTFNHPQYKETYEKEGLTTLKLTQACQLHAVFQCLLDIEDASTEKNDLQNWYEAFNQVYPGKYSSKIVFRTRLTEIRKYGIKFRVLDSRRKGNNNSDRKEETPVYQYLISYLTAHPKKMTGPEILNAINAYCAENGLPGRKISWVKKERAKWERNFEVLESRYGKEAALKMMPYASMNHAHFANQQWMMDGKTFSFYINDYQSKSPLRYTVVLVMDSHSKKIVGFSFGHSETRELIMEAFRDAVNTTGVLPFELVTDNHSSLKTLELLNLKNLLEKKGTAWTVTMNAQHKSILERRNQFFDAHSREYYGYKGQGVRSRSKDALANPEMIHLYLKRENQITINEAKAMVIAIVKTYNDKPQNTMKGLTPNEAFANKQPPNQIEVSVFDRAELLTNQTEMLIRRNQINITVGSVLHEFQLPAKLYTEYNNKRVIVRYDSLKDGIYLFDNNEGDCFAYIPPKEKINGAIVNQTEKDIDLFNRQHGLKKGIQAQARKELEVASKKAFDIDPDIHERISKLITPKGILQQYSEDADLRSFAESKGFDIESIDHVERFYPNGPKSMQPVINTPKSPFKAKNNVIKRIDPLKDLEND